MIKMYGIPNCDTIKKARRWLDDHALPYQFHDYKKAGVPQARLKHWIKQHGWQALVNQRGTTWRQLDAGEQQNLNQASAMRLMQAYPSLIKRPILEANSTVLVGFKAQEYQTLNQKK